MKDTGRELDVSSLEIKGRLVIDNVENGRLPKSEDKTKKWISVLEQNKEAGTIPLNRLESILDTLKALLEKLLNRELSFSLDSLKSRNTELKANQKPKQSNSVKRGR